MAPQGLLRAARPRPPVLPGARWAPFLSLFLGLSFLGRMFLSEQLRQLATQLASLAFLEDVVVHDLQSLQESPVDHSC